MRTVNIIKTFEWTVNYTSADSVIFFRSSKHSSYGAISPFLRFLEHAIFSFQVTKNLAINLAISDKSYFYKDGGITSEFKL